MAIIQLERPTTPVVSRGAELGELLARVEELLIAAAEVSVSSVDDEGLSAAVAGLASVESRAAALRLGLCQEAERRQVADRTVETGTDAWVARLTGTTREQAAGGLRLARLLSEKYHATREAFAAGRLRIEQVRVIVNAAEQAPAEATPAQIGVAEEWLVGKATGDSVRSGRGLDARRLRQTARRMFDAVDHDLADRHQLILLGRETRTAEAETYFALHDDGNGTYSGRFMIPELHGRILTQIIDRLTSPRRLSRDRHGNSITDPSAPGTSNGAHAGETRGQALCELIEHLPTSLSGLQGQPGSGWPGHAGNNTEILVKLDYEALLSARGTAGLSGHEGGTAITAGEARRLACGAGLIPAVLDGASQPLDLGRSQRLHSKSQRRALALSYETCAVAGCTRPFAWCEVHHHQLSWSKGGRTDLDNALPLCGHHHRRAHDTRYDLRQRPDGEWAYHRRT